MTRQRKSFAVIVGKSLLLLFLGQSQVFAQKQDKIKENYFFIQLSPNIQSPLQINEHPYKNLKESFSWGANIEAGYHRKITNKFSLNASLGLSLYSFEYNSGKNDFLELDIPNIQDKNDYIFIREYYYTYNITSTIQYEIKLPKKRVLNVLGGVRILAVWDYLLEQGVSYYINTPQPAYYKLFDSQLSFEPGLKISYVVGVNTPFIFPNSHWGIGIIAHIIPNPLAEGSFAIRNTTRNSSGTTKFYGSSVGINFNYNFK